MKQYRIKKEAVPFILEKHAASIYSKETWESLGICLNTLEEVEPMYIDYGQKYRENSKNLGGWSQEKGAHFSFTIHFPSMKYHEYDVFNKGRITRELMDRIQNELNRVYRNFLNEEE